MKFPVAVAAFLLLAFTLSLWGEPPADGDPEPVPAAEPATLKEARRQAEILHGTIHPTLHIVHQHYYREDEGLRIPAATLKDVFAVLEKEQNVQLRWLVVEGQAMNSDHEARTEFEKQAVQALKSGQQQYEQVEDGTYLHAGPITLTNHCLKCHVPDRKSTEDRIAGLIISIPLQRKAP